MKNFVFFGSPEFAEIILGKLIDAGFAPAAVVCNPDKPVGRKKVLTSPPTKILAQKHDIPVIQFTALDIRNWKLEIEKIKNRGFDFFVVAAYSKIIPKEIIDIPKFGVIGVHPSLLPKYRGATPIQSVILNGEKETGATLFLIDEKVDHGPIIAQRELGYPRPRQGSGGQAISNIQYLNLQKELAELSGDLLVEVLPKFVACEKRASAAHGYGNANAPIRIKELCGIIAREQNHAEATFTKKFTTDDGFVKSEDLEEALALRQAQYKAKDDQKGIEKALEIERKIRALNPDPGVWTLGLKAPLRIPDNKRIKLLEGRLSPSGSLILTRIQVEGKTPFVIKD